MDIVTHPCPNLSQAMLMKEDHGITERQRAWCLRHLVPYWRAQSVCLSALCKDQPKTLELCGSWSEHIRLRHVQYTLPSRYVAAIFSSNKSRKTSHSSPVKARYRVSSLSARSVLPLQQLRCAHYRVIYDSDISTIWGIVYQQWVLRAGTSIYIPQYQRDVIICSRSWHQLLGYKFVSIVVVF